MNQPAPKAPELERSVIASMIYNNNLIAGAVSKIRDEPVFFCHNNAIIWSTIKTMFAENKPVDIVSLNAELPEIIADIAQICLVATSTTIDPWIDVLLKKSALRRAVTSCTEVLGLCSSGDSELEDRAVEKLSAISLEMSQNSGAKEPVRVGDALSGALDRIAKYFDGNMSGVKTGITDLDKSLGGMQNSESIIIAGRPSMGKTALAIQIAYHVACRNKIPTLVFSLEMSRQQLIERLLCSNASVSLHVVRSGQLPRREFPKLSLCAGPLYDGSLWIDDTASISPIEVFAKARTIKARYGLGLIVIDYMQLMHLRGYESRQQEISAISRTMKEISKELDIPVVSLSQLSRKSEDRADQRPMLSDLRESGSIEQDADTVMFVHRPEYYNRNDPKLSNVAEIIIGKQRNGPVGTIETYFDKTHMLFKDLSTTTGDM